MEMLNLPDTLTSMRGFRASILASHGWFVLPRRIAQRTTVMAPVISSRLKSRWPIFDILPTAAFRRSVGRRIATQGES